VLFLAALLADFLAPLREEVFPAPPRLDFLALRLGSVDLARGVSANSSYEAGVEAGVGAGVFSIGSGSIQPEPDQPISM
jgi:hypothetical protein